MILSVTWEKDKECKRSLISRVCFRVSLVTLLTLRTFAAEMPVMWFEQGMISTCGGGTGVSRAERRERAAAACSWRERRGWRATEGERRGRRVERTESGGRRAAMTERRAERGEDGERRGRRATRTESGEDGTSVPKKSIGLHKKSKTPPKKSKSCRKFQSVPTAFSSSTNVHSEWSYPFGCTTERPPPPKNYFLSEPPNRGSGWACQKI